MIEGLPNDDIIQLDNAPTSESDSLRELIMVIERTNKKTLGNLFHDIGQDWKGRITFTLLRNNEDKAQMIADGIIPYLLYYHSIEVLIFVDPEVVIEREDWI